jgi:hypothetical protein
MNAKQYSVYSCITITGFGQLSSESANNEMRLMFAEQTNWQAHAAYYSPAEYRHLVLLWKP